jgi:hypothetical protein
MDGWGVGMPGPWVLTTLLLKGSPALEEDPVSQARNMVPIHNTIHKHNRKHNENIIRALGFR